MGESKTPTSIEVTVVPNAVTTGVVEYIVSAGFMPCTIPATTSPLKCTVTGLTAAMLYPVSARACATPSHCSQPAVTGVFTRPSGNLFPELRFFVSSTIRVTTFLVIK